MNEIFHYEFATSLLGKAQATLASATTLAAALLACNQARAAYDTARGAVRETEFKCSGFVSNCYQVMANAIEIEARAQCRLADEYDAAQERGEVTRRRQYHHPMTMKEIGLSKIRLHRARNVRNAEKKNPGIIRRSLDEQLKKGTAPRRSVLRTACVF